MTAWECHYLLAVDGSNSFLIVTNRDHRARVSRFRRTTNLGPSRHAAPSGDFQTLTYCGFRERSTNSIIRQCAAFAHKHN